MKEEILTVIFVVVGSLAIIALFAVLVFGGNL
jgi:hypothetical protein